MAVECDSGRGVHKRIETSSQGASVPNLSLRVSPQGVCESSGVGPKQRKKSARKSQEV